MDRAVHIVSGHNKPDMIISPPGDYLLQHGVYLQQGFYFSEPLKFEQFSRYFKEDQR